MMYEPVMKLFQTQMEMQMEGEIMKAVQEVGVVVDKDELIKALNYDRQQYQKGYEDGKRESEWIPCSERLPETYGEYLCCDRCGNVILAMPFKESDSDTGYCAESDNCYMWSCTAWMYLP